MTSSQGQKKKSTAQKNAGVSRKRLSVPQVVAMVIAGLLAALMFSSVLLGVVGNAKVTQSDIDKLEGQLNNIKNQKNKLENKITDLKKDTKNLTDQIDALDQKIDLAEQEIGVQEDLIAQLAESIVQKTAELDESQKKEDQQYGKLRERLRFLVENGNMSYLEILLSADNFSEFLSRYEIINQISTYEKKLFEELKAIKEEIEAQKKALEDDQANEQQVKASMEENKAKLDADRTNKELQMQALEKATSEAKADYASIAEEEDRLSEEILKKAKELASQKTYVGGTFLWPLPSGYTTITSPFGMRKHPITGVYKLHTGTDISAPTGTAIYAANSGEVITSQYSTAYGNYVAINHGGGLVTLYAHMSKRLVSEGDTVKKGDTIGKVGSTGYATGPHLHFEIIKNGDYIDPMTQFSMS